MLWPRSASSACSLSPARCSQSDSLAAWEQSISAHPVPRTSSCSRNSLAGWCRKSAVMYPSAPTERTASNRESPAPPHSATRLMRCSGRPAIRSPPAVAGSASAKRSARARRVSGSGSVPTRPVPTGCSSPPSSWVWGSASAVRSVRFRASQSASFTPAMAASALVCAPSRPHWPSMRVCSTCPL